MAQHQQLDTTDHDFISNTSIIQAMLWASGWS
jgi:hypothetical protein